MAKLTEAQVRALHSISEAGRKSGKFHASLGHRAVTLSSLYSRGLAETETYGVIGRPIYGAIWTITAAGRAALASLPQSSAPDRGEG